MIRAFTPFLLTAAIAFAAAYEVNLPYASLALKNGRNLDEVTIKSYDHESGKVTLTAGRSLHSVQIELLPDEVAARVIALVPEENKALAREEKAGRKQEKRQRESTQQERLRQARVDRQRDAGERKQALQDQAEAQARAQWMTTAKQLARDKADHYFRYEYQPGSGSSVVIRQGVTLREPEEVAGWPGRCRVSGNVGLQFYDSRGSSFSTTVREFEVIIQKNDRGIQEVVDFTLK